MVNCPNKAARGRLCSLYLRVPHITKEISNLNLSFVVVTKLYNTCLSPLVYLFAIFGGIQYFCPEIYKMTQYVLCKLNKGWLHAAVILCMWCFFFFFFFK